MFISFSRKFPGLFSDFSGGRGSGFIFRQILRKKRDKTLELFLVFASIFSDANIYLLFSMSMDAFNDRKKDMYGNAIHNLENFRTNKINITSSFFYPNYKKDKNAEIDELIKVLELLNSNHLKISNTTDNREDINSEEELKTLLSTKDHKTLTEEKELIEKFEKMIKTKQNNIQKDDSYNCFKDDFFLMLNNIKQQLNVYSSLTIGGKPKKKKNSKKTAKKNIFKKKL